jgi:hypothetical protein
MQRMLNGRINQYYKTNKEKKLKREGGVTLKKSYFVLFTILFLLAISCSLYFVELNNNMEKMPQVKGNFVLIKDEKTISLYTVIADIKESELSEYNYISYTPASEELAQNLIPRADNVVTYRANFPKELFYFKIYLTKIELESFKSNEKVFFYNSTVSRRI